MSVVFLQDVNDEEPTFGKSRYVGEIGENAQKGTPITFIAAATSNGGDGGGDVSPEIYDYDSGSNGTFQLYIEGGQDIFEVRLPIWLYCSI